MAKLEELKATRDAAWAVYEAELNKTQEEKSGE